MTGQSFPRVNMRLASGGCVGVLAVGARGAPVRGKFVTDRGDRRGGGEGRIPQRRTGASRVCGMVRVAPRVHEGREWAEVRRHHDTSHARRTRSPYPRMRFRGGPGARRAGTPLSIGCGTGPLVGVPGGTPLATIAGSYNQPTNQPHPLAPSPPKSTTLGCGSKKCQKTEAPFLGCRNS